MRSPILTKTALLAAGFFSAAALCSFAADYDSEKGLSFSEYADGIIEVDTSGGQFTLSGRGPSGTGTLVKTGANLLSLEAKISFYSQYSGNLYRDRKSVV